jgi:hypothetical protein
MRRMTRRRFVQAVPHWVPLHCCRMPLLRQKIAKYRALPGTVPAHEVTSFGIIQMDYTSAHIARQDMIASFSPPCYLY